jgi:hypothetical protein
MPDFINGQTLAVWPFSCVCPSEPRTGSRPEGRFSPRPEWKDTPMVNSVNTNPGALIALQNLNATNAQLAITQTRINTGKKVANAKDNGAIWAIAQGQRADIGALGAVKSSLDRGSSALMCRWLRASRSLTSCSN